MSAVANGRISHLPALLRSVHQTCRDDFNTFFNRHACPPKLIYCHDFLSPFGCIVQLAGYSPRFPHSHPSFSTLAPLRDNGGCLYTGGRAWLEGDTTFYTTGRTARDTRAYSGVPSQVGGEGKVVVTNFKGYLCGMGIVHWGNRMQLNNIEVVAALRVCVCVCTQ